MNALTQLCYDTINLLYVGGVLMPLRICAALFIIATFVTWIVILWRGTPLKTTKKIIRDLGSILYDGDGWMSLPRICVALFTVAIFGSWIAQQFFSLPFEGFEALCILAGGAMGQYSFKKFTERSSTSEKKDV